VLERNPLAPVKVRGHRSLDGKVQQKIKSPSMVAARDFAHALIYG